MAMKAFNEDCFMLLLQYGAFDSSSFDFGQIASSLSGPTSPKQEVFLQNALDEVFKSSSCQSEANRQILCDHLARATCTVLIKQHFEMILSRCTKYHKYVASSEVIQRIIEYQPSYLSCLLSAGAISCEGERSAQMLTACIYDNDSRSLSLLQTAIRGGVSVKGGTQAFEKAFNRRFYQSVQFLLDSGIDFTSPQLLNCALSSEYGRTHWETWINSTPSKSVPVETVAFAINNHLSTDLLTRLVQYTVHPLPSELLFVAMYQHDALSLKTLLGLGANIDQSFSVPGTRHKPRTPLQHALLNCWEGCAILLIEAGANFPAPTSPEWNECVPGTFLKLCESNGDTTSLMEIFLGRWPDLLNLKVCAAQKTWRGTCAEIVAKAGKPQRLRFLLRRGALRKPSGERDYAIAGVLLQQLTELVLSIPPYSYDECKISDYSWCAKELIKWGGQVPPILNVGKRLPLAAAISEGNCILALHTTFLCYQKCGEHSLLRSLPQPIIQYIAELLLSHYISKKHELWLPPSFLVHFKE
ncbi:hypothetical protein Pelo_15282 [Pelomyxa schiedti]|nr:hypothetical protein Pelo_15282 [Pelomyxa schiedti]